MALLWCELLPVSRRLYHHYGKHCYAKLSKSGQLGEGITGAHNSGSQVSTYPMSLMPGIAGI